MLVYIRGAGDIATGIALRLHRSGMQVVMTDLERPLAVRRTVSFSEAIRLGEALVEDITAVRAENAQQARQLISSGKIAVLADPDMNSLSELKPDALVDAIIAKKNLGTAMDSAPVVVAVGPGFTAGKDCHAVVETKRGHNLGRAIYEGSAAPNTGVPGIIAGYGIERVLRASANGIFHPVREIGDVIEAGDTVAYVEKTPVISVIGGMIRGMLPDGTPVTEGMKSGDVDPRGTGADYLHASDKAMAVGGGVLEAILCCSKILQSEQS